MDRSAASADAVVVVGREARRQLLVALDPDQRPDAPVEQPRPSWPRAPWTMVPAFPEVAAAWEKSTTLEAADIATDYLLVAE